MVSRWLLVFLVDDLKVFEWNFSQFTSILGIFAEAVRDGLMIFLLCNSCNQTKVLNQRLSVLIHRHSEKYSRELCRGEVSKAALLIYKLKENFSMRTFHLKIEIGGHGWFDFDHRLIKRVSDKFNKLIVFTKQLISDSWGFDSVFTYNNSVSLFVENY